MRISNLMMALLGAIPTLAFGQLSDSSKRVLPVEGAVNFRDIGGYETSSGKHVVWGRIFRSDAIDKLTDADVLLMDRKRIHTVVDLRGTAESKSAPDRLTANSDYTLSPAGSDSLPNPQEMVKALKQKDFLIKFYGEGVQYYGDRYRPAFIKLLGAADGEAVMYHCTGGRDRTGMQTALILYVLGVPYPVIEADYLASNVYLSRNKQMNAYTDAMVAATGMTKQQIEDQMKLKPALLKAFFDGINRKYGTVEQFLQDEMAIGPKEIRILKAKYTR
ncbi:tyrosine-protein phosphatase [Sphingobacterium sp.]|uniref:tyrosine-protein phosphatase n=1 Tax=Sphingobacterium sp. TaxID=341027 RepID=UPI00289BEED3|nr:tyrosine-protein phosphatase [Sphingobacterium sp.]